MEVEKEEEVKVIKVKRSDGTKEEMISKEAYDKVQEELGKEKDKEKNFKKLRNGKKAEREEIDKERKELNDEKRTLKDVMITERIEDALTLLVGEDKELKKKVMLNYERIEGEVFTKDEIYNKVREATLLTDTGKIPNPLNRPASSYSRYETTKTESEESRRMRKDMGVTDEDKKKYGNDDWQPKFK